MEKWQDQGIVLAVRAHGESGAVVSLLTEKHGRACGYVRGARGSKMRGTLEVGSLVDVQWQSRVGDGLGAFVLELSRSYAAEHMRDALRLAALQSACALCDDGVPEREGEAGLFLGLVALFDVLDTEIWGAAYIMWEIAFLKELGFSLDLSECAGGGDNMALAYVSPKTGRAVSYQCGEAYKDKLLPLPDFLKPQGGTADDENVLKGLQMTGHFFMHRVFAHHSRGIPTSRLLFVERFAKTVGEHTLSPDNSKRGENKE